MTVPTSTNSVTYTGNNATTVFSYSFLIPDEDNAVVILTDITDPDNPVDTTLTPSQYTITGIADEGGGTVTYPTSGSPIDTDTRITIQRVLDFTQETDLTNQGGLYPQVIEAALDKLTMLCQQLDEQISRAVLVPIGSTEDIDLSTLIAALNAAVAALASATAILTPCTATGTNIQLLTPVIGSVSSYIDQNLFSFVAAGTSTSTVTANVSGLGAKKIYLATGVQANADDITNGIYYLLAYVAALDSAAGGFYIVGTTAVTNANLASMVQTTLKGRQYGNGTGSPQDLTAAQARAVVGPQNSIFTGSFIASVAANALTVAIKTLAGADPSATDPIFVTFSDGAGGLVTRAIVAATSIVISSGSTLGTANSIPFRLWLVAFDDAGTVRFGIVNCALTDGIFTLDEWNTKSSTAEGGAGAADSAGVIYTGSAVSSKYFRIIGMLSYTSGLGTAGTWSAGPTNSQLFEPGMKRPSDVVQIRENEVSDLAATTTTTPFDDTIPAQATEGTLVMSQVITPSGTMNRLVIEAIIMFASDTTVTLTLALHQDATSAAIAAIPMGADSAGRGYSAAFRHIMRAETVSATTFKIHIGPSSAATVSFNGSAGARRYGGVAASTLRVTELMV